MTISPLEEETITSFDSDYFATRMRQVIDQALPEFQRAIRGPVWFNLAFLTLGSLELIAFVLCLSWLTQSMWLATSLALIFLTLFSYFVLRLYFQAKKPVDFERLSTRFLTNCHNLIQFQRGLPEHHLAVAHSLTRFAATLHGREHNQYELPQRLAFLIPGIERFSAWWHWEDVLHMRERLLLQAVEEHTYVVRCEPTNLQAHIALANAYVMLSSLYVEHRKSDSSDEDRRAVPLHLVETLEAKFRAAAQRAMEEFKILNHYAPDDPWIHTQLAYSYRDLQMPQEEIRQFEAVIRLRPDDRETLYRLGVLYFQQGFNAQGLRVYEQLRKGNYKQAESLIKYYGAYRPVASS